MLLGVNIDHVGTLRQARGTSYPDPLKAALDAEEAGADSITLHLREDRRHIIDQDVYNMKLTLQTAMNLEIALTDEMIAIAADIKPQHVCFVPEKREELTTEGGLDVVRNIDKITEASHYLSSKNIEISLFIDPDLSQIKAALMCGVSAIELHTGHYAESIDAKTQKKTLFTLQKALNFALQEQLIVNAGHGLHYNNVEPVASLFGLNTLNIGHAIIARAIFVGLKQAVVEMKALMQSAQLRDITH